MSDYPNGWGVGVAWLSWEYDSEPVTPTHGYLAAEELRTQWKEWFETYIGHDANLNLIVNVDDVDKRSVRVRTKDGETDVDAKVPVAEFLAGRGEREVLREVFAWLYEQYALKMGWPAPPPLQ